ncbi:succinylglutamate desuccinylase/aspartoacylase family protein [Candidatus Gottesmanbacteria bacterium]|nr:succinylglutamate desuccinylase/aspartoacylase family protein [Candidatus Gottesmanbacteria bacterium]
MNEQQPTSIDTQWANTPLQNEREPFARNTLFIAATHGNEGFSIPVLEKLEREYPKKQFGYNWTIGNRKALSANRRYTESDLNRSAPGNLKSPLFEERRAAQLMDISNDFDTVIDIHGTTADVGICTIIPYPSLQNILFSSVLPIKNNVIWYAEESLVKGPITQFCKQPALEIECGPKDSPIIATQLFDVLEKSLSGMQAMDPLQWCQSIEKKEYFQVYGSLPGRIDDLVNFQQYSLGDESFFPFLANQYSDIACFKMKRLSLPEVWMY